MIATVRHLLLAGAVAPFWCVPAIAQDDAEGAAIVVRGQGLPDVPAEQVYSTAALERDEITAAPSGRLEDALGSIAGFQQFRRSDSRSSNPSAQGVTLRALGGNASSRAVILLDGVPLSDPFFGYIPFSSVAPERLDTIRVTRGGGSGRFGSGSLAGAIEMSSADATTLGPVSARGLINSRGGTELSVSLAPQIGDGFAVISGRWDRDRGFFTTPEVERVAATARARNDAWSVNARWVHDLGGGIEAQVNGSAFRDERTLRFKGADSSSQGHDMSLRLISRGPWQVEAVGYRQQRNFTNIVISSSRFVRVLDQKDSPSTGTGGKLEVRPATGDDHTVRMGVDYRRSEGDLAEDAYSAFSGNLTEARFAGGVNKEFGLYLENDWHTGALTLTGGLRATRYVIGGGYYRALDGAGTLNRDDRYSRRSSWEATWRMGALFRANEAMHLRTAIYTGVRLPTLNELYRPFVVFPVVTNANENLNPERLKGWELGVDLSPDAGIKFQATYFDNTVEDAIANVTLAANLRQRRNLDAIKAKGLELSGAIERGDFSFNSTLNITDAKMHGAGFAAPLDGNRPSQVPDFSATAALAWRPAEGAVFVASLRHTGAQFEDDQEIDVLPAATTLNLYMQMPVGAGVSIVGRAENLTDNKIITRNQGGSLDIGIPRTLWLGLRVGL